MRPTAAGAAATRPPRCCGGWDPRIPLDNNATERAIRGPVVGRKNHYGSKSRLGTQVAATLYTVLETAKLHGVDPAAYLAASQAEQARRASVVRRCTPLDTHDRRQRPARCMCHAPLTRRYSALGR